MLGSCLPGSPRCEGLMSDTECRICWKEGRVGGRERERGRKDLVSESIP